MKKAFFFRKFDVPYWALAHAFGHNPVWWYRQERALGRFSLVGTTSRKRADLPEDLGADEKHTRLQGEKHYVATTVAEECILGTEVTSSAGDDALLKGYEIFQKESKDHYPDYSPKTVNTDAWSATRKAWKTLFPNITLILCFLHVFIKIRDRMKKKQQDLFQDLGDRLWHCYDATTKRSFSQRVRRFADWAINLEVSDPVKQAIQKLRERIQDYSCAYDFTNPHRTSNMLDRLMQKMDRHLFSTRYFHGSMEAANRGIRAWALIQNFAPSNPSTIKKYGGKQSPAERYNRGAYHHKWLENLLISASLGGKRGAPHNP